MDRNPPLNALKAFEAVARLGSFKAAAAELNITQSAVSHQIANLETRLGAALFLRNGRKAELSGKGRQFFPFLEEAFGKIAEGLRTVTSPARQELTVQVYVTVASRWMMGRLHRLQAACPDLLVRFNASQMDWAFDPSSADVGMICSRQISRPGFDHIALFEARLNAVCSPALLAKGPPVEKAADVVRHRLLEVYTARSDWEVWLEAAGAAHPGANAAIQFDSYLLALEAAADGQGIAVIPDFLAGADLKSGRLALASELAPKQPEIWQLAARKGKFKEPAAAQFRDWLLAETEELRAGLSRSSLNGIV